MEVGVVALFEAATAFFLPGLRRAFVGGFGFSLDSSPLPDDVEIGSWRVEALAILGVDEFA